MNNLPKTLVAFDKSQGQIILAFDDKTIIKLVANCDEGECWLSEAVLTNQEKVVYGLMSEDALTLLKRKEYDDRTQSLMDDKLISAWKNFHEHGPESGFPQPTRLPEHVANIFNRTDWSKIDGNQTMLTYRGINFINERPTGK